MKRKYNKLKDTTEQKQQSFPQQQQTIQQQSFPQQQTFQSYPSQQQTFQAYPPQSSYQFQQTMGPLLAQQRQLFGQQSQSNYTDLLQSKLY